MGFAYVYAVLVDGIIRYVGKGSGRRLRTHMKIVRSMARRRAAGEVVVAESPFYEKLCKAYLFGSDIEAVMLNSGLTHEQAFRDEIAERKKYPASQLWNAGSCWDKPPYRAKQKARWADPELRALHRKHTAEAARKPHAVELQSKRLKSAWNDPERRAALLDGIRRYRASVSHTTLSGRIHAYVRDNPGKSFTEIKTAFKQSKGDPNTLARLRKKGLVFKADGKHGGYFAENDISIQRSTS